MPIYEFTCSSCDSDFEYLVRGTRWQGEVKCPSCGQNKADKLSKKMSAASVGAISGGAAEMPSCSGNTGSCFRCNGGM
jgi:putative FmdB family regulatory protein